MKHNEPDPETFPSDAYAVKGWGAGIAFSVLGWETAPTEDTEWDGFEERTGKVNVRMIGDDTIHRVNEADLTPLARKDYCGHCGQVGCSHDGLDRDDE